MAKSQADKIKLAVAVVALLGAGFFMLKFTGVIGGGGAADRAPERSDAEQKRIDEEFEEQEAIQKELEEKGEIEIGGA